MRGKQVGILSIALTFSVIKHFPFIFIDENPALSRLLTLFFPFPGRAFLYGDWIPFSSKFPIEAYLAWLSNDGTGSLGEGTGTGLAKKNSHLSHFSYSIKGPIYGKQKERTQLHM